jgi:hypothetical protein
MTGWTHRSRFKCFIDHITIRISLYNFFLTGLLTAAKSQENTASSPTASPRTISKLKI